MGAGRDKIDLLRGTLDLLILRTLLVGPAHGHQIAKHIQRRCRLVPESGMHGRIPRCGL